MIKYAIGAVVGGLVGYFVLYRLIGCSTGSCPITASPYISTIFGVIFGLLIAASISSPSDSAPAAEASAEISASIPAAQYKKITAEEAKARIDSGDEVIVVDVRTEAEYLERHIPDAVLLPNENIGDAMPEELPDLDAEILLYCRTGNRSAQAAYKLIALGYTNVYDFGGIVDWPYETVSGA